MKRWLLIVAALMCCAPAWATITNVNVTSNTCVAGTTCVVTYSPTPGNLVRVGVLFNTSGSAMAVPTTNGSGGTAFAWAKESDCTNVSSFRCGEAYTCNVATGVTQITLHFPVSDTAAYFIEEKSGQDTGACLDATSTQASGSGVTQTSNSLTTTGTDAVCGLFVNTGASSPAFLTSTPWTLRVSQGFAGGGAVIGTTEQLNVAAGPYSPAASTASTITWIGEATSYKAAAVGASGPSVTVGPASIVLKPGTTLMPGATIKIR